MIQPGNGDCTLNIFLKPKNDLCKDLPRQVRATIVTKGEFKNLLVRVKSSDFLAYLAGGY